MANGSARRASTLSAVDERTEIPILGNVLISTAGDVAADGDLLVGRCEPCSPCTGRPTSTGPGRSHHCCAPWVRPRAGCLIFPVHPRTRDRLNASGLATALAGLAGVHAPPPLGYLDMLALLEHPEVVLTDAGGVQEETTYFGVPCLTLRDTTERPATVTDGTNRVIGARPDRMLSEIERILDGDRPAPRRPPLWDGHAAERVADVLANFAALAGG